MLPAFRRHYSARPRPVIFPSTFVRTGRGIEATTRRSIPQPPASAAPPPPPPATKSTSPSTTQPLTAPLALGPTVTPNHSLLRPVEDLTHTALSGKSRWDRQPVSKPPSSPATNPSPKVPTFPESSPTSDQRLSNVQVQDPPKKLRWSEEITNWSGTVPFDPDAPADSTTGELYVPPPRDDWEYSTMAPKRGLDDGRYKKKLKRMRATMPEPCLADDVLWQDVKELLGQEEVDNAIREGIEFDMPYEPGEIIEVEVAMLCSNGKGLALAPEEKGRKWALQIPFCFPGEIVRVKVYKALRMHSACDLIEVVKPNPDYRDESLVKCKYFRNCGGCQYQMLPYEKQLQIKHDVVINAYKKYFDADISLVPDVSPTIGSPLQYDYRTKMTPHFHLGGNNRRIATEEQQPPPPIGFNSMTQGVIDIEECPIMTPAINKQLPLSRQKVHDTIDTFKQGSTLLLRESLKIDVDLPLPSTLSPEELDDARNSKIVITNNNGSVRERVGDTFFEYLANSFFQNNNSILLSLTDYIKEAIFPPGLVNKPTHLIDTYCGAGLFGIVLADKFQKVTGVELSPDSILYAKRNARLNKIPTSKISFRLGDAVDIFGVVGDFPSRNTAIIIDPPRKGCGTDFIQQVVAFQPQTVVYISCNVHSQARDLGNLMDWATRSGAGDKKYVFESLRGFDLFPQTAHVESVAVLRLVDA